MEYRDCPECDGTGRCEYEVPRPMSFSNLYGYLDTEIGDCENCGGSGEIEVDEEDLFDDEVEDDGFVTVHPKIGGAA